MSSSIDEFNANIEKHDKGTQNINCTNYLSLSWKLGLTTASSEDPTGDKMKPFVLMNFEVEEGKKQQSICFDMSFDEFKSLQRELKGVRKKMMTA